MRIVHLAFVSLLAACGGTHKHDTSVPTATAAPRTGLQIKLTTIFVDDQDKALHFYTDVLGFVKKDDVANGGYRWLTVMAPGDADGGALQLASNADPAAKAFQQAMFGNHQPATMFYTTDVQADYDRIKAKGGNFTMPVNDIGFAKITMLDDTCGNLIQLTQLR